MTPCQPHRCSNSESAAIHIRRVLRGQLGFKNTILALQVLWFFDDAPGLGTWTDAGWLGMQRLSRGVKKNAKNKTSTTVHADVFIR